MCLNRGAENAKHSSLLCGSEFGLQDVLRLEPRAGYHKSGRPRFAT
jgi:hypothetical protein